MGLLVSMMNGLGVGLNVGLDVGLDVGLGVGSDVGLGILMGVGYPIIGSKGARMEGDISMISAGFAVGLGIDFGVSLGGSTVIAESKRGADTWPTLAEIAIRANERFMVLSKLVCEGRIQPGEFFCHETVEATSEVHN